MFFIFTPNLGEMIQFDEHIFGMGGSTTIKDSFKSHPFGTIQVVKNASRSVCPWS